MYNYTVMLQIFEINPTSEEIVHFFLVFFVILNVFLMITTTMLCFDKLYFLLAVGDMLEPNFFNIPDSDSVVDK